MRVFYFASGSDGLTRKLRDLIESAAPDSDITRYSSVEDLAAALLREVRPDGQGVAVLLCASRAELRKMLGLTSLLADMTRIVILPDRDADTISEGLKLLPNFFSYSDGNLADIGAVFKKISLKTT
ncbi:MAG: hypothetical protein A2521_11090 [Deltaproteobacteria bacterium RIFOXYD12_FULL_57_12]|nr:MAG: hypothetical protein A2521_11090 [Deltaproteobacteria bacterium RIFOXYD12_FULL_57_12]